MSKIPADVMEAARLIALKVYEAYTDDDCGKHDPGEIVARAILAERERHKPALAVLGLVYRGLKAGHITSKAMLPTNGPIHELIDDVDAALDAVRVFEKEATK